MLRSKALIFATLTVLAAAGCGSDSSEGNDQGSGGVSTVKVGLSGNAETYAAYYVADAKGIFGKHGIKVEQSIVQSGAPMQAAMASKSLDVGGFGWINFLQLREQGVEAQAVGTWNCLNASGVVADADSGITSVDQLAGKKVGIVRPATSTDFVLDLVLKDAGVDPKSVQKVALGTELSAYIGALKSNTVDATYQYPPIGAQLAKMQLSKPLVDFAKREGPAIIHEACINVVAGTSEFLERNPETAANFVAALQEAADFVNDSANRDEVAEIVSKAMGQELDITTFDLNLFYGAEFGEKITQEMFDKTVEYNKTIGGIKADTAFSFDDSVNAVGRA